MMDRRYFRYFDWFSFALVTVIVSLGLLFVFSATYKPEAPVSFLFKKQLVGALIGYVIYFVFCIFDSKRLARLGLLAFGVTLCFLVYSFVGGMIAMGAKRWVSLFFFRFQPSELAKLFLPVFIASYFTEIEVPKYTLKAERPFKAYVFPLVVLFFTSALILKQPDLGTSLLVLLSGFVLLWFVRIPRKFFVALGICSILGAPLLWKGLKVYQQNRILVLFGYGDARKERYQVEQSKIAIGSGGLCGKGLLQGTQNKFEFLPEDHTDFIFSVLCEECGFMGALLVIALYVALFTRIIYVLLQVPNYFEQIVGLGLLVHIMLSTCINMGMVTGMLPTVGIPLPLFSYGLTNLWINLASLGWLNNIAIRRFYY